MGTIKECECTPFLHCLNWGALSKSLLTLNCSQWFSSCLMTSRKHCGCEGHLPSVNSVCSWKKVDCPQWKLLRWTQVEIKASADTAADLAVKSLSVKNLANYHCSSALYLHSFTAEDFCSLLSLPVFFSFCLFFLYFMDMELFVFVVFILHIWTKQTSAILLDYSIFPYCSCNKAKREFKRHTLKSLSYCWWTLFTLLNTFACCLPVCLLTGNCPLQAW